MEIEIRPAVPDDAGELITLPLVFLEKRLSSA
jgi:hypothetical protein